jgi:hypothetical protein
MGPGDGLIDGARELVLRDIHDAPPPGFWPPAPGWWLLALLALLAVIWAAFSRYRHWRRRRAALEALEKARRTFATSPDPARLAADLSVLLRRVALARFAPRHVAGLTGREWLAFLDETGGEGGCFSNGVGSALITAPYAPGAELDAEAILAVVEDWLKKNA